jgi:hypothetical protein
VGLVDDFKHGVRLLSMNADVPALMQCPWSLSFFPFDVPRGTEGLRPRFLGSSHRAKVGFHFRAPKNSP